MSKYLVNSVEDCVVESLYGFSKLHPHLFVDLRSKVLFDSSLQDDQHVAIISGGGSGHEPFPAGYIGNGMLTGSVSGEIFTSPPPKHILRAIRLGANKSKEVLLIVPNYTGDVLNFGLAVEMAIDEGIKVESLVVGEDVAQVTQGIFTKAGRRGTCGLVLAIKFAGFLSAIGRNLSTVKSLVADIMKSAASLGLSISACSKPGKTGVLFHLEKNEFELGSGVHGEAGVLRIRNLTAEEAVNGILERLIRFLSLEADNEVVVVVNNYGSLTHLEQCLLVGEIDKQLTEKGILLLRLYADRFFTSLNMSGFQICLLKVDANMKELILLSLDYPTSAPAWINKSAANALSDSPKTFTKLIESESAPEKPPTRGKGQKLSETGEKFLLLSLMNLSNELIVEEEHLNRLDTICGDGDCGSTFKHMAKAILAKIDDGELNFSHPPVLFAQLSSTVQEAAGGTTGALYGLFLRGISRHLQSYAGFTDCRMLPLSWREGVETIKKYSSARLGDRTMLDPLETGCNVFQKELEGSCKSGLEAFRTAVSACKEAAEKTREMVARAGRASYAHPSTQMEVDAGAHAVTIWISAILKTAEDIFKV